MIELNKIHHINCYQGLKQVPDASIRVCVTSPPYYGLRDYGLEKTHWPAMEYKLFGFTIHVPEMECCLGLEDTPEAFIGHLILIFREVRRVLTTDGTAWVNLGDSYWGGKGKSGQSYSAEYQKERFNAGRSFNGAQHQIGGRKQTRPTDQRHAEIKPKDLLGMPWMFAFAMRADGWYLRQDNIWNKPNPMPESVTDRCTKAHEYIFHLSKSHTYYFNQEAIMQPVAQSVVNDKRLYNDYQAERPERNYPGAPSKGGGLLKRSSGNKARKPGSERGCPENTGSNVMSHVPWEGMYANKKSVWTISTKPYKEAHFAVFPEDLPTDCILAGSVEGDTVLDPFSGSGTTASVAARLGRKYLGFEQNAEYIKLSDRRLHKAMGLFKEE